jgi:hypothetical protein
MMVQHGAVRKTGDRKRNKWTNYERTLSICALNFKGNCMSINGTFQYQLFGSHAPSNPMASKRWFYWFLLHSHS